MLPISRMIVELASLLMFGATVMVWTVILTDPHLRAVLFAGLRIIARGF